MTLSEKKVLVYGSGKSGQGAATLLEKLGAHPFIYDDAMGDLPSDIADYAMAVLSPGVPVDNPHVQAIKAAGVRVVGEVELAYEAARGRVFAITGTNGKTTTTSLLGEIMKTAQDDVFVVGNIGTPYTSVSLDTTERSAIVAEMSSFQLETIDTFHPVVSAILNITEDHLNRHHTMQEYSRVKENIIKNQSSVDTVVLNYEDDELRNFGLELKEAATQMPFGSAPSAYHSAISLKEEVPGVIFFSSARKLEEGFYLEGDRIMMSLNGRVEMAFETEKITVLGIHNYENVMAAAAMAYAGGVSMDVIRQAVYAFKAVEHRIEYVGEKNGVVWYNDSKGTNPDAAIKGIQAMKWPTFLIGGGYDKGSDYKSWIRAFDGKVKYFLLEGKTKYDIRDAALACGFPEEKIIMLDNMTEAMAFAASHAEAGDAVLLSPACASWGEFPNYEVRGQAFKNFFDRI